MKAKKIIISLIISLITIGSVFSVKLITNAETVNKAVSESAEEDLLYGIGSTSKVFTTAAVMILVDQGKVNLDVPLTKYISEFEMADERYKKITPRMLLNHSSGLRGSNYNNTFLLGDNDRIAYNQLLTNLKSESLKADPGEYSVYCNDGFTLAEILIERVSGMSFTDFIQKYITKPLDMNNTITSQSDTSLYNFSKGYSKSNNMELPTENISIIGTGGIYSTAEDLCKFSRLFMSDSYNNILSKECVEAVANVDENKTMINYEMNDTNFNYGLGWDCVDLYPFNQYGIKALSKGGTTNSYHSNLTVLSEENMSAAVISSGGSGFEDLVSQQILLAVLDELGRIDEIKEEKSYELDMEDSNFKYVDIPEIILEYEGLYMGKSLLKVEFKDKGKMLLSTLGTENNMTQEYVYSEDGTFRSKDGTFIAGDGSLMYGYNGIKGSTKLQFKKNGNKQQYIVASSYESYPGLGQRAECAPIAQKVSANNLSSDVNEVWKKRNDKKYYIVNEKSTSSSYIYGTNLKLIYEEKSQGYCENIKIENENTARAFINVPGMVGRDWMDYIFFKEDNIEYVNNGGNIYICEDGIKDIGTIIDSVKIGANGYAQWYKVSDEYKGREATIDKPKDGNFFVYDEDDNCIYSSIALNSTNKIILPQNGRVTFVGMDNSEFKIKL